jgi:feruloyl-CoA synthase
VREHVYAGLASLKAEGGGSSTYATHALFLIEPPSIDAGEITDKGYINQRAELERRAGLVEQLYDASLSAEVIVNR